MFRQLLLLCGMLLSLHSPAWGSGFDHSIWDRLLKTHVIVLRNGQASQVDYVGMAADQLKLKQYLNLVATVKRVDFDRWATNEQLAFLINVYNASTVDLVLTGYPNIKSIKNLGSFFKSPWKTSFISVLGKTRTLDDVEHVLIRGSGRYNDPRVHFAVNCASIGCPALRAEAYEAGNLDAQLEDQTLNFLADSSRNRMVENSLKVSSIFKWYREDFENGWQGIHQLADFFMHYSKAMSLSTSQIFKLQRGEIEIEYLAYDWQLNSTH